jgi:hypothetical protein
MSRTAFAVFVAVWMALVVLANWLIFPGDRSPAQLIVSNIGILIAMWIAARIYLRSKSDQHTH